MGNVEDIPTPHRSLAVLRNRDELGVVKMEVNSPAMLWIMEGSHKTVLESLGHPFIDNHAQVPRLQAR